MKERVHTQSGIPCPFCGSTYSAVCDSRPDDEGRIRRRRECRNGHRFTTREAVDLKHVVDFQI